MIAISDLPGNLVWRFEGKDHRSSVSFYIGTFDPGTGPSLHTHPYDETFIVEAGSATFTVSDETFELGAGEIAVVPANTPHKFVRGEAFRLISIAPSDQMIQEDLEA